MKRIFLAICLLSFLFITQQKSIAQNVAITDDNGYSADPSAMLDVKSLSKGFLTPRMTTAQRTAISNPANGLLVYDTSLARFYYYNGSTWIDVSSGSASGPFWSYNSPNIYLTTSTNYLGLGTTSPLHKLHIMQSVSNLTGTDGAYIDIQNNYNAYGTTAGIRLTNGTSGSPNVFKGGIYYQDRRTWNRGDLIFSNRNSADAINVSTDDARLIIRNEGSVEVKGSSELGAGDAIFHVENANGDTVFAVYPEGVRVYVDDNPGKATGSRGGFAVGGFSGAKTLTHEYLRVTPDSVRVYIDDDYIDAKAVGSKGGFAVGGFSNAKGITSNYLFVQDDSSRVYVADSTEGFGVASIQGGPTNSFMDMTTQNYYIGHQSGQMNTTGEYNSVLGYQSALSNTTGSKNVFLGYKSGFSNQTGQDNVFIGFQSGFSSLHGWGNVFIGESTGKANVSGGYNTFVGQIAGLSNYMGANNTFLGASAGMTNYAGNNNVYVGTGAGSTNMYSDNVFVGFEAGADLGGWGYNVCIGSQTADNTEGAANVFLGYQAGSHAAETTVHGNVNIGYQAGRSNTSSDRLFIENSSASGSAALIYGEFDNDILVFNADVGVGVLAPSQSLDVSGEIELNNSLFFRSGNFSIYNGNSRKIVDSWWSGGLGATGLNVGDYTAINSAYDWSGDEPSSIITSNGFPFVVTLGNGGTAYQTALMVMNNSGDLGIGTTSPDNKLDVAGKISLTQSATDEMVIINDDQWQHSSGIHTFGNGGDYFVMASKEGSSESAGIFGDGNSITLWSPGDGNGGQAQAYLYILDEDLFTSADTDPYNNGALKAYVTNAGVWQVSDINKKQNISKLNNATSKIAAINGYTYEYKLCESETEKGQTPEVACGIMAQELEIVLPEAVQTNANGDKFVNYSSVIPLMIEAIKEQNSVISSLDVKNKELTERLEALEKK